MRKRIVEIIVLALFLVVMIHFSKNIQYEVQTTKTAQKIEQTELPEQIYVTVVHDTLESEQEEIRNEITYGEIELLAQIIRAEAGNQDETGKRYVADVVLNRVASKKFPDTIEKVLYQDRQFSCTTDGNFDKAAYMMTEEDYQIALEEYTGERLNTEILYFRTGRYSDSGTPAFQYGNHYFNK